ncbi:hypothetical protein RJ640_004013 [Escallonia rubra]|uniref:Transmembrane protein n=1 Tax=Escallonia rubra TaxID=112253 RepID=A0AA88QJ75_9ASTE|nr:hypothetical protein RJ640_004013 [Escallonia rubra]
MAVAEARTAWQRTANRCFVQEDAKRAPKLACCPSASSSTKQVDPGPASADGLENPTIGFVPLDRNPSYSNLPPDARWWLQLQPTYGHQRGLTNEQLNTLEAEMETFRASVVSSNSRPSGLDIQNDGSCVTDTAVSEPSMETHGRTSATCMKKDIGVRSPDLKAVYAKNMQEPLNIEDAVESYEFLEMDPVSCMVSKQPNERGFDSVSSWIGGEKSEPWWRTADRHDLASFVAQRSVDIIENCDLPQPQSTHVKRDEYADVGSLVRDGIFTSSKDRQLNTAPHPNPTVVHSRRSVTSVGACGQPQSGAHKPVSDGTANKGMAERFTSDGDSSKAQLLEALRHSQTRAREAENAAKQAYAEKEHIVKLFFRQASHLFAYRQWFQLLQLEDLYIQIKNNKNQPFSTLLPSALPWLPHKTMKMRKSWHRVAKRKRTKRVHPRYDISKYAVVFALGLSLVGAGLLLGWTVGWMLPAL